MLPAAHRMRRASDFTSAVRAGSRARAGGVVVHHRTGTTATPALVGFVVSKAVGNSVVRHRVARRLRSQSALRLHALAPGSVTVVRALPASATATSVDLGRDLDRALERIGRAAAPIGRR